MWMGVVYFSATRVYLMDTQCTTELVQSCSNWLNPLQTGSMFKGKEFCVVNGTSEMTKEKMERIIVEVSR